MTLFTSITYTGDLIWCFLCMLRFGTPYQQFKLNYTSQTYNYAKGSGKKRMKIKNES